MKLIVFNNVIPNHSPITVFHPKCCALIFINRFQQFVGCIPWLQLYLKITYTLFLVHKCKVSFFQLKFSVKNPVLLLIFKIKNCCICRIVQLEVGINDTKGVFFPLVDSHINILVVVIVALVGDARETICALTLGASHDYHMVVL